MLRVVWCNRLKPADLFQAPGSANYRLAACEAEKRPGLFGEGFGGEALVVLNDDDDGLWFKRFAEKETGCNGRILCRHLLKKEPKAGKDEWTCISCDAINSTVDAECQFCECGGADCRRDTCSGANHLKKEDA